MSYVDTWSYSGQRLGQIFSMQMGLDQENQSAVEINAFKVPDLVDGQLKIKVRLGIGAQFYVNFIYEPGTVTLEDERFVITNTSSCPPQLNNVPLELNESQEVDEFSSLNNGGECEPTANVNNVPLAPNESREVDEGTILSMSKDSRVRIDYECAGYGFLVFLILELFEDDLVHNFPLLLIAFLDGLEANSPDCDAGVYKTAAKATESNRVTLELKSGAARFESARSDLEINIETGTATVNSFSQNDFAVGYNPDADMTIAACYKGSVTVDPANTALSGVTLEAGQYVKVTSNSIGPVTRISKASPVSFLLLLNDDGK